MSSARRGAVDNVILISGGVGNPLVLAGTVDPSAGAGTPAPESSTYLRFTAGAGQLWLKTGALDTEWARIDGLTVEEEGVSVATRSILNFIGSDVTAVDDPGNNRVNVTISTSVPGTLIYSRTNQTILRDGLNNALTTILPAATIIDLDGPGLGTTYSGAGVLPYINPGVDGQILLLHHKSGAGLIQFNAGVVGSGVRLQSASNKTISIDDYIQFVYDAGTATWDQIVPVANI